MNKHPLQTMFEDLAEELGNDDLSIRSYSGRGMYGKQCLGVYTDMNIGSLMAYVVRSLAGVASFDNQDAEDASEEIAQAFENMQTDSMGLGTIVYFPNVKFVSTSDEE